MDKEQSVCLGVEAPGAESPGALYDLVLDANLLVAHRSRRLHYLVLSWDSPQAQTRSCLCCPLPILGSPGRE